MSTSKKIETGFATIRTDYIRDEANGHASISTHLEHGLKEPGLAAETRYIAHKLRDLAEKLEALPQAQVIK